ncbi:MAG: adenylate/guanylate cyclase domain-containing protein, partial [Anaerolineaceae bacterium]|nr:adenylate/guanylate cyclase domain-containing protein [Anaerolineaceae bacterium]
MAELPTGTVTFLFTDIEGSTPLWEQMPEAMRPAVALHLDLLHQAIEANGGLVFKVIGDAIQAAFPLASGALAAALASQRVLHTADWPAQTGPLNVRMGLHTGPAEIEPSLGGTDYAISHTLNRVARIMSAGHGGQILLSQETTGMLERSLPPEVTFKDLGEHQLKGMARLEHLFQVCAPDLPDDFPPLSTSISHPGNLPAQLTSFIGREAEIDALCRLVTSGANRLVTLTGPGGTGKTRLALQAASDLLTSFRDGVWLVELAPLADPARVPLTVAAALGLHETPGRPIIQKLVDYINPRQILLILDNCEHVVGEAAALAGTLLQSCSNLQIIATSREILGTMGETPFRVPSLALPGQHISALSELIGCESIRLFVERATTTLPSFRLTETNAPLVARICQRLDGIPLAIELAAARIRLLSVDQIAARLDDSFRLLTGGSRTVLSRHQTLRALIDWSYDLLLPDEKVLFLRLSVFAGGFTLEAAEHVCSDQLTPDLFAPDKNAPVNVLLDSDVILDLLTQLVDKSLVIPTESLAEKETRYHMLETIRQYARDKLHDSGRGATVRDQHLAYFLLMAEEAEPYLRGANQVAWFDRLDDELDNLRLALEWSLAGRVDEGLRLAASLLWFWHIRGHGNEGSVWLEQLLAAGQNPAGPDSRPNRRLIRARALIVTGFLTQFQLQAESSLPMLEQAVNILRDLGQVGRRWLGVALLFLSKPIRDHDQRGQLMEEAYPLLCEAGDPLYLAEYAMDRGNFLTEENKIESATNALLESMALREETQDVDGMGTAAMTLGDMALFRRDYGECKRLYEKSLECYKTVKNKTMESICFSRLGNIDMLTGNFTQAAGYFEAGIAINQQTGDRLGMINSLFDLGRLDLNINEFVRAGHHFAEITRIGVEHGSPQAVLSGLLFQGLAAQEMGNSEKVKNFAQQAIDYWRGIEKDYFSPGYIGGNLEILAVLLVSEHPELASRIL